MNNLFLVTSPLQLINAIEAREYFKTINNKIVAIFTEYESKNKNQILNLLKENDWDDILRYDLRAKDTKTTFFAQIKLIKILKEQQYNLIFCGDLSSIIKVTLANLHKNKVYLLDDGATTINRHLNEFNKKIKKKRSLKKISRQIRFNCFGVKTKLHDTINMFTSYKLIPNHDEEIIHNDLKYFKQTYLSNTSIDTNIYLLGMQLSEINILKRQVYINYIKTIQNQYKNKKIIYIPHRFEKNIDDIKIMENNNFKVLYTNLPIELEFITTFRYPLNICSFFSSALFTLNILYPNAKIVAFKPKYIDMLIDTTNIDNVYKYIKTSTTINTIEL